jgi:cysteinyl-tRNA synthetase
MYNCGPTVYDYAHIGNFFSYVFADVLRRYLEFKGYKVKQVMNITDVGHLTKDDIEAGEDKIQLAAKKKKVSPYDIAKFYEQAFVEDARKLNLEEPFKRPRATKHINEMISITKKLLDKGHAYEVNGSVYYDITSFKNYGALSGNTVDRLREGASGRELENKDKRNFYDFALWVNDPEHLMKWKSPWSVGYPGWHIECTAMSTKYLGQPIDIHTGGEDNIFPHHEAEIAQTEGATGKQFVRFWMHTRHLKIGGEKMAKSLGNFYTPEDIYKRGFSPRQLRFYLLSNQYRQPMNFTFEGLEASNKSLQKLLTFMHDLKYYKGKEKEGSKVSPLLSKARKGFEEAMDDDLNISRALAAVYEFVSEGNKLIAQKKLCTNGAKDLLKQMQAFDKVLGVLYEEKEPIPNDVKKLVEEREAARKAGNWEKSDKIRQELKDKGIEIQDTEQGPRVVFKFKINQKA